MRMQRGTILAAVASAAIVCVAGVSKVDSRYFADEADKTFVPIGCNICFPRMYDAAAPLDGTASLDCEGMKYFETELSADEVRRAFASAEVAK